MHSEAAGVIIPVASSKATGDSSRLENAENISIDCLLFEESDKDPRSAYMPCNCSFMR
jgi:hypothetical protein